MPCCGVHRLVRRGSRLQERRELQIPPHPLRPLVSVCVTEVVMFHWSCCGCLYSSVTEQRREREERGADQSLERAQGSSQESR